MTDPSLVHRGPAAPRQTHVMLIGVGTYDHLNEGTGQLANDHFGLGQLTSPPASARALADWFIRHFDCPDRPLGTLRLLLSEAQPSSYHNPASGAVFEVPNADLASTKAAVRAWSESEASVDDQLIFYFCGHGLAGGVDHLCPLRDFGLDDPEDDGPLARAINLNRFATGLATARASNQLLILDTCRDREELIEANANDGAALVVARPDRRLGIRGSMSQCVIYSTEPDSQARGRPHQPSLCAEALMRVLDGAAASLSGGVWQIKSMLISNAITELQERQFAAGYAAQRSDLTRAANIAVRRFAGEPKVPVFIGRRDGASLAGAEVEYGPVGAESRVKTRIETAEWEGAVPIGSHRFIVTADSGPPPVLDLERTAAPTYLRLEVL